MINFAHTLYDPAEDFAWDATYEVEVVWVDGEPFPAKVTLVEWIHGDERKTKAAAVELYGADWIENQEAGACEAWSESHLDDTLDQIADLAAE